jgi:hypothetical protein
VKKLARLSLAALLLLGSISSAFSQEVVESILLQGPRVGFTYVSASQVQWMHENYKKMSQTARDGGMIISQFGWQFEERFIQFSDGGSLVIESILLVGGLERSMFIPTASFLIGSRSAKGFEFGLGPNLAPGSVGLVFAFGWTYVKENAFIPVNFAISSSKNGARLSVLVGFNARRK